MMNFLKGLGLLASLGLLGLAVVLACEPWRAHGGRFATEFLALAAVAGLAGVVILVLSLR
jgi:hypothetical protein